jgi:dipeptidase D
MITQDLKPERLWYFFETLSAIPRASGNERQVLDYLKGFARERNIDFNGDKAGNMVMRGSAGGGPKDKPVVVIQSHIDMVCEKNASTIHDFDHDPIRLKRDGEWIRAEGTSLGADNGIGVAAMLAMLSDPAVKPWPVEYLFTVEEEVGLNGARALDTDLLTGSMLINLDTEEVGTLYIGCAGGRDSDLFFPMQRESTKHRMSFLQMGVSGLRGGHSGAEIHLGGSNAIKLLARVLSELRKSFPVHLVSITGGDKDNAIPREAEAVIAVPEGNADAVQEQFTRCVSHIGDAARAVEPGLQFHLKKQQNDTTPFTMDCTERLVDALMVIPHGVLAMSSIMEDLVETSSNLSSIRTGENQVHVHASHRSSVSNALSWVADVHRSIASLSGAGLEQDEGYPGWNPDPSSKLLSYASEGLRRVLGKEPAVRAIHAGLECGVIKQKVEGMDAVSMGPTIVAPHSPDERVLVESVNTFWNILIQTLELIYSP